MRREYKIDDDIFQTKRILEVDKERNRFTILHKFFDMEAGRELSSHLDIINLNDDVVVDGLIALGWSPPDGC